LNDLNASVICSAESSLEVSNQIHFEDLDTLPALDHSQNGFQDSPLWWGETWNVGVIPHSYSQLVGEPELLASTQWLFEKSGSEYFCDPWLVWNDRERILFYERFDRILGKGTINSASLRKNEGGWFLTDRQTAIEEPFHLSHPCVFWIEGKWYMIPEAADSGSIIIYEAEEFPYRWGKGKILIPGFKGIDPVLVFCEGLYWLFCGDESFEHNANLNAFFSESIFGPWTPHFANPVVEGLGASRPAGPPFLFSGKLIRPAQDCRFTYGGALAFHEIKQLSPGKFSEELSWSLPPCPGSHYPHGIHSIFPSQDLCIIDGKTFSGLKRLLGPGLVELRKARDYWSRVNA